jgi:signal transduction histidine kinase
MGGQLSHGVPENIAGSAVVLGTLSALASLASALFSLILAVTFFRRRFEEPAAVALSFYLLVYAVVMAGPLESWFSYWTGDVGWALAMQTSLLATPSVALFVLFPNGRFVPPWTRWVLLLTIPWSISLFFLPGFDSTLTSSLNPVELGLVVLWYGSFLVVGLYAQVYRYRRVSSPQERQQTKWVVFGFILWLVYILLSTPPYLYLTNLPPGSPVPWWAPANELSWSLALNILPISLAVAISRYRLWNIDLVINRSLVYGTLTASVIGIYALVVGVAGTVFQAQGNWLVALVATGLIAVLFQPLRDGLQRWVNRLVYGQRDEPFEVLARLARRLEGILTPRLVYPTIVETVAQTLKLPYAAIAVSADDGFETVESFGKPGNDLVTYPLIYQGEVVGQLLVARRAPNEDFTEADDRLLGSIAQQAGTAVHAVQLTADLLRSRHRLVTTREEERRRLRRDLHDGLGPTLAAHRLKIGSVRALLEQDPAMADRLLVELENDMGATLSEVRQLVYNLRPPALDQFGLVGAIRAYAAECERGQAEDGRGELAILIAAPDDLPTLPAAVEVAAYHIAREALANVIHHARARQCTLRLTLKKSVPNGDEDQLKLTVQDDGEGFVDSEPAGLGLTSMRERAQEVGGAFTAESVVGQGTRLTAVLPLGHP